MRIIRFKLLLLVLITLFGPVIAFSQKIAKESIASEGKKRTYYLYVPASVKPLAPAPLLVLLHGSSRNGLSLVEKWKDLAEKEGIILLGPDSADSSRWSVPNDGPGFVHELVEALKTKHPINGRKVYLFGHSGGAIFALLMSLYESEYFAATAVHAGVLYSESAALMDVAKRKTPIHLQVGSEDPLFPLKAVRATRDALTARGFPVQLREIPGHDHWYYDLAPKINLEAWQFLKTHELSTEPIFEEYRFRSEGRTSREATEQYARGTQLHRTGDVTGAIAAYTRAIELDRKFADAYNNRGVAYIAQKDYPAAVADFTRSLEIAPSDAAYNNRGNIYFSMNRIDEAIADFTAALKLKPSVEGYTNRGTAYQQTNQDTLALADYERALQLNPKFARVYVLRGLLILKTGQDAAAQKDFDRAFELDPGLRAEFDPIISQTRANRRMD